LIIRKVSARTALAIVLLIITLITSSITAVNTANYSQFYKALAGIRLDLTSLLFKPVTDSYGATKAVANITFTINNPTSYKGIILTGVVPIFVVNASGLVTRPTGLTTIFESEPLLSNRIFAISFPFNSTWDRTWQNPQFVFTMTLLLSTFLDKVATFFTTFQCQSGGGPGICEQLAVSILGKGGFGGGGGGGV
jgi:hypothetical protein